MTNPTPVTALEKLIDAAFSGYGMALRSEGDPPIPGEPLMSMADAKRITRELLEQRSAAAPVTPEEREALIDMLYDEGRYDDDHLYRADAIIAAGWRPDPTAGQWLKTVRYGITRGLSYVGGQGTSNAQARDALTAALHAIPGEAEDVEGPPAASSAVPEGWVMVPVEPTEHQVQSARMPYEELCLAASGSANWMDAFGVIYRAMIAAAPPAPSQDLAPSPDVEGTLRAALPSLEDELDKIRSSYRNSMVEIARLRAVSPR